MLGMRDHAQRRSQHHREQPQEHQRELRGIAEVE
jgi:hypothetical protein